MRRVRYYLYSVALTCGWVAQVRHKSKSSAAFLVRKAFPNTRIKGGVKKGVIAKDSLGLRDPDTLPKNFHYVDVVGKWKQETTMTIREMSEPKIYSMLRAVSFPAFRKDRPGGFISANWAVTILIALVGLCIIWATTNPK